MPGHDMDQGYRSMARRHSTQKAYARRALLMAGCAGTAQADYVGRFGPAQASVPTLVGIFSRV